MRTGLVAVAVALAGCAPSLEELRSEPPRFEISVPAVWDKVGACLVAAYADDMQPLYVPVPSERRAELTLHTLGGLFSAPLKYATFDIKGVANGAMITYRVRKPIGARTGEDARAKVAACGTV